ncbi:MAG TPA: acyl-CoA synthetase FdrA [Ktedonobacterales bacterium]|jgi:FdrA protein
MITKTLVRRNLYADSVALMQLSRALTALPEVEDAAAVMSTAANRELLQQAGLLGADADPGEFGGPNDLLIIIRAATDAAIEAALLAAEQGLSHRAGGETGTVAQQRPRSLEQAARQQPALNLALISVPGAYAAVEAHQALLAGLHVLLFSDNVSLEQEVALKMLAAERGLLLMGPDCGTAIINGIGLGFANAVPRGSIGIASASGTGLQQVSCLIAHAGLGISQAIGTGGRDLSQAVGGRTMLAGLDLLQQDPETSVIILLSKPPAPEIAQRVLERAAQGSKPTVVAFLGSHLDRSVGPSAAHLHLANTLSSAARLAVQLAGGRVVLENESLTEEIRAAAQAAKAALSPEQRYVRGLFSGGTLCDEAMLVLSQRLGPIASNIPLRPEWALTNPNQSQGHTAIDLGSDEFTVGRPHPMIDAGLRLRRLAQEARDPTTAVLLLDIVLGYGAHPDPAAEIAPAIQEARKEAAQAGRNLACIVSLCGTEQDPQSLSRQREELQRAGALVFTENALAAQVAAESAPAKRSQ